MRVPPCTTGEGPRARKARAPEVEPDCPGGRREGTSMTRYLQRSAQDAGASDELET